MGHVTIQKTRLNSPIGKESKQRFFVLHYLIVVYTHNRITTLVSDKISLNRLPRGRCVGLRSYELFMVVPCAFTSAYMQREKERVREFGVYRQRWNVPCADSYQHWSWDGESRGIKPPGETDHEIPFARSTIWYRGGNV